MPRPVVETTPLSHGATSLLGSLFTPGRRTAGQPLESRERLLRITIDYTPVVFSRWFLKSIDMFIVLYVSMDGLIFFASVTAIYKISSTSLHKNSSNSNGILVP